MRACPKCKTTEYNNRFFVLLINECGHSLCRNCVDNLFARNSAPCPTCGRSLKKNNFWEQQFDDPLVEKELYFRKKFKKVYNLQEDDFDTEGEYNDYLERFEALVWNMAHDIEVEAVRAEVEQFAADNAEKIMRNKSRRTLDEQWVNGQLQAEYNMHERTRMYQQHQAQLAAVSQKGRGSDSKDVIEELKSSDLPAELILDAKRKQAVEAEIVERERKKQLKAQQQQETRTRYQASVARGHDLQDDCQLQPFQFVDPPSVCQDGPPMPSIQELADNGYFNHVRAANPSQMAGGYHHWIACMRAIQESHDSLFMNLEE